MTAEPRTLTVAMEIPLFPLHTVLCPGIVLPLHIFEERYRTLVARCLASDGRFGVVLIREGAEVAPSGTLAISAVGTFAEIREASRYSDGRYDLQCVGAGRFRIHDATLGDAGYLVGEVEPLPEVVGDEDEARRLMGAVTTRFVDYLALLRPRDGEEAEELDVRLEIEVEAAEDDDEPGADEPGPVEPGAERTLDLGDDEPAEVTQRLVVPDDPTILSYLLSGIVRVEHTRRQLLLEAETTVERLAELGTILEREVTLLGFRLRPFTADPRTLQIRRN